MNIELSQSEVKILLESIINLEGNFNKICTVSDDDDEIADYGNDLIELRLLLEKLKKLAVDHYGEEILCFSRELL